jgi:hypothetical protein
MLLFNLASIEMPILILKNLICKHYFFVIQVVYIYIFSSKDNMLCVSFLIIRVALQVENFKTDDSKQAVGK